VSAVLWHIEVSHYNEKARWALDYKKVPHERRAPLPGFHGFWALVLTRGAQRRLPVLELEGRRIGDSTAIIAALEDPRPTPPLYPPDADERDRALALEDFFDEDLAPEIRRFVWAHTLGDANATAETLMTRSGPAMKRLVRTLVPLMAPAVRWDYTVNEETGRRARERIVAAMDRVEAELGSRDYLVGGAFSVADLTAAALFTPVLCPPGRQYAPPAVSAPVRELRSELEQRAGGEWVATMFARHRGVSAEIA
jgi:glutathione S-transferase